MGVSSFRSTLRVMRVPVSEVVAHVVLARVGRFATGSDLHDHSLPLSDFELARFFVGLALLKKGLAGFSSKSPKMAERSE
jgi:hypothetical protein